MEDAGGRWRGWLRDNGDLLAATLSLLLILFDRNVQLLFSGEVDAVLMAETGVLSGLVIVAHGWVLYRLKIGTTPYVVYGLLAFSSALLAVSFWENGALVASLLLYILLVGVSLTQVTYALSISTIWLVSAGLLSRYPSVWGSATQVTAATELRGLLYLLFLAGYLQYRLVKLIQQTRQQARSIESLSTAVEELSAANMSYNTFVQMAESQAARHERSRITREIHDGVGYALTNLIMVAESTQDLLSHEHHAASGRLTTIRNQAKLALSDTRRALRELRAAEQGLVYGRSALVHMMEVFEQATGVTAKREFLIPRGVLEDERLFPVVYRFVQEALTNAFRHGHATCVEVRFWIVEGVLIVSVNDDGKGAAEVKEGIGLQGMRERLGEIGGELYYHYLKGFTVIARIPVGDPEDSYA